MKSRNSQTSDSHRLLLILQIKKTYKQVVNTLLYQIIAFAVHGRIEKSHTKITNFKYQLQRGMINSNYLTDQILYQIFKIISSIF